MTMPWAPHARIGLSLIHIWPAFYDMDKDRIVHLDILEDSLPHGVQLGGDYLLYTRAAASGDREGEILYYLIDTRSLS